MHSATHLETPSDTAGHVQRWGVQHAGAPEDAAPDLILICEHASNRLATPWQETDATLMASHAASDLGALGLAQALGEQMAKAHGLVVELIHAPLSRLIYDLNRSPDRPDAVPAQTELHRIGMNAQVTPAEKLNRVMQLYLPFHALVQARIARALALGQRPVLLTVHTFTPVWHGVPREVEFGVIHDDAPGLARRIIDESAALDLVTRLNEPYSATDHVTHTLRLHATPYRLENAMLELRNDLVATPDVQADMAALLAPILARAMSHVAELSCQAS